jgi:hypothetical protein
VQSNSASSMVASRIHSGAERRYESGGGALGRLMQPCIRREVARDMSMLVAGGACGWRCAYARLVCTPAHRARRCSPAASLSRPVPPHAACVPIHLDDHPSIGRRATTTQAILTSALPRPRTTSGPHTAAVRRRFDHTATPRRVHSPPSPQSSRRLIGIRRAARSSASGLTSSVRDVVRQVCRGDVVRR